MTLLHRRLERLFCCLLLLAGTAAHAADPARTLIQDTIYRADGTPASGKLQISWPAFVTGDNKPVAAGNLSVSIGPGGGINLALMPTQGASPAGSYYKVVLNLDDHTTSTEYWSVPTTSPTTIAAIRSSMVPASVALQVVSREYVDTADATSVHKAGDETIAGTKTFSSAPLVPTPEAAQAAANKDYVDAAVASGGAGVLALSRGGTSNEIWTSARCVRVADDGSRLESAGADCGGADLASPGPIGGTAPAAGTFTSGLFKNLNAIRFSDRFVGATLANRVAAALADLGGTPGVVVIPSNEPWTDITGLVLLSDKQILLDLRNSGPGSTQAQNVLLWDGSAAGANPNGPNVLQLARSFNNPGVTGADGFVSRVHFSGVAGNSVGNPLEAGAFITQARGLTQAAGNAALIGATVTKSTYGAISVDRFLGFNVDDGFDAGTTGTITNYVNYNSPAVNALPAGLGITNAYGFYAEYPNRATNNYAAYFNGRTVVSAGTTPDAEALLTVRVPNTKSGKAFQVVNVLNGDSPTFWADSTGHVVASNGLQIVTNAETGSGGNTLWLGSADGAKNKYLRVNAASGALEFINSAFTASSAVLTDAGEFDAYGGLRVMTTTAEPACDNTRRGLLWYVQSAAGVKDRTDVCQKNADDTYSWKDAAGTSLTSKLRCEPGLGDGLNAIVSGTYLQSTCYNDSGMTWTITGIKCYTDNNGSSTLNATTGAGAGLLNGAVTCTNSWAAATQSATTTLAGGDYIKFTFAADGTSKQTTWVVSFTQ